MLDDVIPLIQNCLKGHEEAWCTFVHTYSAKADSILSWKFPNLTKDDREDIIQKVFLNLHRSGLRNFQGTSPYEFAGYFNTIVKNEALRYIDANSKIKTVTTDANAAGDEEDHLAFDTPDTAVFTRPDRRAEARETLDCIAREMEGSPLVDKQVLLLKIKGRKDADISTLLGIPSGTVAVKYSRIKSKLRERCYEEK